jgi:hypothetical protein
MFPAARTVHDLEGPNNLETEVKCERPDEMILLAKRFRVVNEFFLHTQNAPGRCRYFGNSSGSLSISTLWKIFWLMH